MQPQRGPLTLGQKLQIIITHNNGGLFGELSSEHSVDESVIGCVLTNPTRFKEGTIKQSRHRHLRLVDKLRKFYLLGNAVRPIESCAEFKVSQSIIYRMKANREKFDHNG